MDVKPAITATRKRKANFSDGEMIVFLEGILCERHIIQSKFQTSVTNRLKKEAWQFILASVNACGVSLRTIEDIKKWKDSKSAALANVRSQTKTGGGPAPNPPPFFDQVMAIVGEKSDATHGIDGKFYEFAQ